MTAGLSVRVLGSLRVSVDGIPVDVRGGLRRRLVLALVAGGERGVTTDAIADALWHSASRRDGTPNAVQAHVSRLRRVLSPEPTRAASWLVSRADGYVLRPDYLDVVELENRITAAEAMSVSAPRAALAELARALDLCAAPIAEDFTAWNDAVQRLTHRTLGAQDMWADLAARYGTPDDADRILALARAEPTREARWCLAMRALAASGRQVEALEVYAVARRRLLDDFGLEPGRDLRLTQDAVLRQDLDLHRAPATAHAGPQPRIAPRPVTSFVGRTHEFDELERLAGDGRIVTLFGLGGVGKSRLLGEWVHRSGRAGSSVWVDLRGVGAAEVMLRIADELGLLAGDQGAAHVLDTIVAATSGLPTLLLLDNADDVIEQVADLVVVLTDQLPQLVVLVTSRSPLGVPGERVLTVRPLALDEDGHTGEALALAASRLDPGTPPDVVADVARRSGGLPLAIELIAGSGIDDLALGSDVEPGLGRITDTALDHLAPDTTRLLHALLVIPAGAPATLVDTLAGSIDGPPARRQRLIRELVGACLVTPVPYRSVTAAPAIRYRVLQPIMDLQTARVDVVDRDAAYEHIWAWISARLRPDAFTSPDRVAHLEVLEELATLRQLLSWWSQRDPARYFETALRTSDFWQWSGRAAEGKALLRKALERYQPPPTARAEALVQLAFGEGLGTMAAGLPLAEEALDLLDDAGINTGPVYAVAHGLRAVGLGWRGDLAGSDAAAAMARAAGPDDPTSVFYLNLDQAYALSWVMRGDPARGIPLARETARRFADLDDPNAAATSMHFAANLARYAGQEPGPELDLGDRYAEQAQPHVRALLAGERARHALSTGRSDAVELLSDAIRLTEQTGNLRTAAVGRRELGLHHLQLGDVVAARHELSLAARRLARLDRAQAALAIGGLARLASAGLQRDALSAAAWALALAPGSVPLTPVEQRRLVGLVGATPEGLPDLEAALAVLDESTVAPTPAPAGASSVHVASPVPR